MRITALDVQTLVGQPRALCNKKPADQRQALDDHAELKIVSAPETQSGAAPDHDASFTYTGF